MGEPDAPAPGVAGQRLHELRLLEDDIGRALDDSLRSGELARAPSWGRPLDLDDAFARTPVELRMPFKVLRDAGVLPPEVELMQRIAALQAEHDAAPADDAAGPARLQRLAEWRQMLALRLERLRGSGRL